MEGASDQKQTAKVHPRIAKSLAKIDNIYDGNDTLKNGSSELQDLSRNLSKMWGKFDEEHC